MLVEPGKNSTNKTGSVPRILTERSGEELVTAFILIALKFSPSHTLDNKRHFKCGLLFSAGIGGYMGLLLGASVISIVEIFDFVIYNCIRKAAWRKKTVPIQQVKPAKQGDVMPY